MSAGFIKKLLLCVFLLVITIVLKAQVSSFSFGNGSVNSPYQIQTAQQLDAVRLCCSQQWHRCHFPK